MKRIFFHLLIVLLSVSMAYDLLSTWRGISLLRPPYRSQDIFLRAIRWAPSNPDPFHGLSLFYLWDLRSGDLRKSLSYLHQAIERNPCEQTYWIHLARIYQRLGEKKGFERALQNAIFVNPTGYQGRWVTGNLFLQEEDIPNALPHFSYLLRHYPEQSSLIYDVWSKVVEDPDFLLAKLVPPDASSLRSYLSYLYEQNDVASVKKVWQRRASLPQRPDRSETLRQIEFLISRNEWREAMEVWKARLQEEGLSIPSDGNLITNGGFEKEEILGGGFDWKISDVKGAKVDFDRSVALEGKSALRIDFDGKENVDFHHIHQIVLLKPNTDYSLKAYMKTKGITTKSGVRIDVFGIGSAFQASSESLVGDHDWKELRVAFQTTAQSQAGMVRVRREKTDKFDRLISGTVWIDDVRLTESWD
ncbi:MAG: carbohydrate binding domain-containing protein [Thermodesulfobacteriota bacterium]